MKRSTWISLALAAPALALGVCAQALESDKQQPTTIDANQMTYNEKSNVNVFTGNVLLTRGSLVIRGDKLTLTERSDGTQFATVEGKPARFKQQRDSEKPNEVLLINGTGNTIEFDGNKSIEQNTEFLNVVGTPNSSGSSRVQAVIKPKTQETEPTPTGGSK